MPWPTGIGLVMLAQVATDGSEELSLPALAVLVVVVSLWRLAVRQRFSTPSGQVVPYAIAAPLILGVAGCEDCEELDAEVERLKTNILTAAAAANPPIAAPCTTLPNAEFERACAEYARAKQRADECHGD